MALLVPRELDPSEIDPESEGRVVTALRDRLSDEWLVIPKVPIVVNHRDFEIDVVLMSKSLGIYLLEVKGGAITIRQGEWYTSGKKLKKSPFIQISDAKYALKDRLKEMGIDLSAKYFRHLVVLPDVDEVPAGGIGPDSPRELCWTRYELIAPESALKHLASGHSMIPQDKVIGALRAIRPNLELSIVDGRFHQGAMKRIDEETKERLSVLKSLTNNQRFLVTGAAGTGKTYLVEQWARQTSARGEKTLLVCFNRPLAAELSERLEDTNVEVRSFHAFARHLLQPFGFEIPMDNSNDWWLTEPAKMIIENSTSIAERFDAIVVDEGQDFPHSWIDALEALHDPEGPRRLLMVADPLQNIYVKDWSAPPRMPSLELNTNLRSSQAVSRHVHELGGATINQSAPEGPPVLTLTSTDEDLIKVVEREVIRLNRESGIPLSQIAVLTRHRGEKNRLINSSCSISFVDWEDREESKVICSTIHRLKGLERIAIILVDLDDEPERELDYVGSSRASLHLTVIRRDRIEPVDVNP